MFFKRKPTSPPATSPAIQATAPSASTHPIAAQFEQALAVHQEGRLPEAAALYEAILTLDPAHFDALHMRGVIAAQTGDPAHAISLIDRALAVDARQAQAHFHRALALREQGKREDALEGFEAVLGLDECHAEAWTARAELARDLGRTDDALRSFGRALALEPHAVSVLFARGVLLQGLQRQELALADYDAALSLQPDFAGAINNRALALLALRRFEEAHKGFEQLAQLMPGHAPAQLGRGRALAALGSHEQACEVFHGALALDQTLPGLQLELGRSLRETGHLPQAHVAFEAAIAELPDDAVAWYERAITLQLDGRVTEAIEAYDRALQLAPGFAEAHANRAMARLGRDQYKEALEDIDQAVSRRPESAQMWINRGLILSRMERHAEALVSHGQALALEPESAQAHANRGHCLEKLHRLAEALASYERACAIEPANPHYQYGRGALLHLLERHAEALACYDLALAALPERADWLSNRAAALRLLRRPAAARAEYIRILHIDPEYPYALGNLIHIELQLSDWTHYGERDRVLAGIGAGQPADLPFQALSITDSGITQIQCARLHARQAYPDPAPPWRGATHRHQRIRLAYLSADLSFHPVSYLMARLFETHDRGRFEVHAVSLKPLGDAPFDKRMRGAFEHFMDAHAMSDEEVAGELRARGIDIAVDLMGYTTVARTGVFMRRAAPVQVAYLGYAGTLGTGCMDYLIADGIAIPPGSERFFDEQVVRLPVSFMPRDPTLPDAPVPTRAQAGLPEHGFVFCCFNNSFKINPPIFDIWMRLLKAVPGSVLWLSPPGKEVRDNLLREAGARGVNAARLVFAEKLPAIEAHLARSSLADLFLDTLPYNAHTTASDALWSGVPLLTCSGEAMASRVAASLLHDAGLPELITTDLAGYEALALNLARDPARLATLRRRLAESRAGGTLFDLTRLRASLEDAFETMHKRHRQGMAPAGFSVPG